MRRASSYVVNAAIAAVVLSYVLRLSHGDRGVIDWIVIGLVVAALLAFLVLLGRRLYRDGGGKAVWHLQRTLLFWVIGLLNTVWLRPEDAGTWKNWLGWLLLLLAAADTVALFLKERRGVGERRRDEPAAGA